ncbi:MAG: hypothetical protein SFU91_07005 [Chloroherpetonaceae bacterium]|nr:hypothetical protein [Chloroherpetonaceae bacterium]
MIHSTLKLTDTIFDAAEQFFEGKSTQRSLANSLALVFLASLIVIEFSRQGWLFEPLASLIPKNHFYAVGLAFTLLLIIEVLSLVFTLAHSTSDSLGKQFEILSIILLRQSFKEFVNFEEPIRWATIGEKIYPVLSDAFGGVIIFLIVGLFYRAQRYIPITKDAQFLTKFYSTKKLLALALLFIFTSIGIYDLVRMVQGVSDTYFFETFFTILIFSDILIIFISLRYSADYQRVFRNSGYALTTVIIRLALTAPPFVNITLGIGAALFALGLTAAYNLFSKEKEDRILNASSLSSEKAS